MRLTAALSSWHLPSGGEENEVELPRSTSQDAGISALYLPFPWVASECF